MDFPLDNIICSGTDCLLEGNIDIDIGRLGGRCCAAVRLVFSCVFIRGREAWRSKTDEIMRQRIHFVSD